MRGSVVRRLLIVVPVVVALTLVSLFMPAQQVSIEGVGTLSFETTVTLSVGSEVAYASPDTERQSPDAILAITKLTPNDVTYIQDDPDTPDANWLVATKRNVNTDVGVSFLTPTGNPTVGADLQEFRALVRRYSQTQTGVPQARIELWENGVLKRAGADVDVPLGTLVVSFTWDANEIGTANGSLVECRVVGTKASGAGGVKNTVDVGAVEWNVDYTPPTPAISVDYTSKDFEVVAPNTSYWSKGNLIPPDWADGLNDGECYFTVTNIGDPCSITIRATNFISDGDDWALVSTDPMGNNNEARLTAFKSGDESEDGVILTTLEQDFILGLVTSIMWEIKLETGTFTDGVVKESTITLTATLD